MARRRRSGPSAHPRAERLRGGGDRAVRPVRPARDGRLLAGAGGTAACVRRGLLPRARHDASGRDQTSRERPRPGAHPLPRLLEVGLDDRDPLAPGVLLGAHRRPRRPVRGDHRSRLRARAAGAGAGLPRDVPGRAGDRRALLGALAVRDRAGVADGRRARALPRPRGGDDGGAAAGGRESGARARPAARGGVEVRSRQGLPRLASVGLRALGRTAARGVDRQAGQGARARAGRAGGGVGPAARRGASP